MPAPDSQAKAGKDGEQDGEAKEHVLPGHEPGGRGGKNAADQSDDEGAARVEEGLDEIAVDLAGSRRFVRLVEIDAIHL